MPRRLIPRGTYLIILRAPELRPRADTDGRRVAAPRREIRTWARFRPGRGGEGPDAGGQERGRTAGIWEVRRVNVSAVTAKWTLEHGGQVSGIVSILPSTQGRGRSHVDITAESVE